MPAKKKSAKKAVPFWQDEAKIAHAFNLLVSSFNRIANSVSSKDEEQETALKEMARQVSYLGFSAPDRSSPGALESISMQLRDGVQINVDASSLASIAEAIDGLGGDNKVAEAIFELGVAGSDIAEALNRIADNMKPAAATLPLRNTVMTSRIASAEEKEAFRREVEADENAEIVREIQAEEEMSGV